MANHGVWVQPHLVDHVSGGVTAALRRRRLVTPQVSAELKTMLEDVVSEGTGTLAAVPGYTVAGKTGTAQKPDGHGGYSSSRYVASFVGMVPASKPRLVILVMVDEPRGAIWGGVVAAPAFSQIAQFDLQYLEVPPDAAYRHEVGAAARSHPKPPPTHGGRDFRGEMRTCGCRESADSGPRPGSFVGVSG